MRTTLIGLAAAAVIGLTGLAHGLWTGRWQAAEGLERALAELDRFPQDVGDWKGETADTDPRQFARVGADGFLVRRYVNRVTGRSVLLTLFCGRPGPISVHTPDVCYASAGYQAAGSPTRRAVRAAAEAPAAEFFAGTFRKEGSASLRIFWAWRVPGEAWAAPDNPRWRFARAGALFKLYVIREMTSADERPDDDPALDFLRQVLSWPESS